MSEQEPTQEEIVESIYAYVAEQMQNGLWDSQIEANLMQQGLEADTARAVISNLRDAKSKAVSSAGAKNMAYGPLWCIGGIVITAITYSAAEGGGSYVVAWGAITCLSGRIAPSPKP